MPAEHNSTRGQLGIGFSSAKIVRVWGRWRDATAALSGERDHSTVAERAYRRTYLGAGRTREEPLAAVRMWLESHDGSSYSVDYDDWAREYVPVAGEGYEVPPAGRVGGRLYRLRAEVEAWVAAKRETHCGAQGQGAPTGYRARESDARLSDRQGPPRDARYQQGHRD
jgi:hypothetical protein